MSQVSSFTVANAGGAAVRAAINGIVGALQSCSSGATAPTVTVAGMFWFDTANQIMKVRNNANTAWISLGPETVAAKTVRGNSSGSAGAIGDINMATLATMLGFASSIADPGYITLPSGLIIQWGTSAAIAAGGGQAVTFPLAFPTACFRVLTSPYTSANNTSVFSVGARAVTTSGFTATNNSGTSGSVSASWIALGN